MITIAITGGIGSGKSEVTNYLISKGYTVVDADKMSREMTSAGGKAIPYIREHFGPAFILEDGSLNRAAMRDLVFRDPSKKKLLEEGTTKVVLADIEAIIDGLNVPDRVKADAKAVYALIAEAESHAHNQPVTEIHFHEVGTMDAVADVTAVCLAMAELDADKVVVSPIHVGTGHVHCAHGILPVPAPATAYILQGLPIYGGKIQGELCTPTGAALLKHFGTEFGDMPVMRVEKTGYGMGKKDFPAANCVRVMLGESSDLGDKVVELNCNVDDMTAEEIGFAMERLFDAGAYEVFTIPVNMKKNRPGTLIRVLANPAKKQEMAAAIFKYTTTIGIREVPCSRYILKRETETVETAYGPVRVKKSEGYGVKVAKYEFEDVARIAREQNMNIREVREKL